MARPIDPPDDGREGFQVGWDCATTGCAAQQNVFCVASLSRLDLKSTRKGRPSSLLPNPKLRHCKARLVVHRRKPLPPHQRPATLAMKPALSFILVLLVAAQACSGARVLLGGAAASGQASGSTSASVTVGASVSGDNAIVGGEAKAEGKQTSTNLELSASNPTASSKLTTSGQAAGEDGTNLQSNGIVTLAPDTVTATGFTTGTAKGKDAVVAANTEAESKTKKYGTATAQSETFGTGSKKITGTAGVATISSPTGLQSESGSASESWKRSGLANSVARIVGPSPNSKTNANTFIFLTKDAVTGDATASGSGGNAQVQAALELLEKARVRWAWKP